MQNKIAQGVCIRKQRKCKKIKEFHLIKNGKALLTSVHHFKSENRKKLLWVFILLNAAIVNGNLVTF